MKKIKGNVAHKFDKPVPKTANYINNKMYFSNTNILMFSKKVNVFVHS